MNQGHEIRSFALNKETRKGQGLKGSAAHLFPNFLWMPPKVVCYTAVLGGGALRNDTKDGCVADYPQGWSGKV